MNYLKIALARYCERYGQPDLIKDILYGVIVAIETDKHIITAEEDIFKGYSLSIPTNAVKHALSTDKEIMHFTAKDEVFYEFNPNRIKMLGKPDYYAKRAIYRINKEHQKDTTDKPHRNTYAECSDCGEIIDIELIDDSKTMVIDGKRIFGMGYCENCEKIHLATDKTEHDIVKEHYRNGVFVRAYLREKKDRSVR